MQISRRTVLTATLATAIAPRVSQAQADAPAYLFSHFHGNGESGLHLAWSADGYHWKSLNKDRSFLAPKLGDKLMRDPCIVAGPDGTFHMVWTTGWWDRGFGYASSKDLVRWSDQKLVPVNEKTPEAKNTWAPEMFYDRKAGEYLIVWATHVPGRFPETDKDDKHNHRLYFTRTKDFRTFTEAALFYDPGYSCIDATIVEFADVYRMVLKDERPGKKCLKVATAPSPTGPWSPPGEPIGGDWVEGPSVLKVGQDWLIYFDHYTEPKRYGALSTRDWRTYTEVTDRMTFPKDFRHGTAFAVPRKVLDALLAL